MYKQNFIKEVVLEIKFNSPITDLKSTALMRFKNGLKFKDVEFKEETIRRFELDVKDGSQSFDISTVGKKATFHFNRGINKFVLDNGGFLLAVNKYENFKKFFDMFKLGFIVLKQNFAIKEFKRVGLRYINRIHIDEIKKISDWSKFINSSFIPNYKRTIINDTNLTTRRNINTFVFGDGEYFVNINAGIWNNNFPSKIIDKKFIIDIDCYIDNLILSDKDIQHRPKKMNFITFNCFESLVTSKFKEILREA